MRSGSLVVGCCAVLAACRGTPAAAPQPELRVAPDAGIALQVADAAAPSLPVDPAPGVEEPEDDGDVLTDLGATLDARPFVYLARRNVMVATTVYLNDVVPEPYMDEEAEVFAVALPGGPSLVCVGIEICWGIEGEMKLLDVPDEDLLRTAPYLFLSAVMADEGRVDLEVSTEDWAESAASATPDRRVDTFSYTDAPTWARPWVEWHSDLTGVEIVSGTRPAAHVFVADGERGVLCVAQDAGYRCGAPVPTGAGQDDVGYLPRHLDFGPTIVAVERHSSGGGDDAYYRASATLLFDAGDPALPWIATIPASGYSRTPVKPDDAIPLLDVYLEWTVVPPRRGRALDPRCFEIRRSSRSRARRFVHDRNAGQGVGVRKASLPRLPRAETVPLEATPQELSTGASFAGKWRLGADGSLERVARCRPGRGT